MDNGLAFQVMSRKDAFEQSKSFAKTANCYNGSVWNANIVLDCLRQKSSSELIHLAEYIAGYVTTGNVDDISKEGSILPDIPDQLLKFGHFNKVPVIWAATKGKAVCHFQL